MKKKIEYGKVAIDKDAFEPRNVKQRIMLFIDQDLLIEIRKAAKKKRKRCETLLNEILRTAIFGPHEPKRARPTTTRSKATVGSVKRGLSQSKKGKVKYLGSFAKYVEDNDE